MNTTERLALVNQLREAAHKRMKCTSGMLLKAAAELESMDSRLSGTAAEHPRLSAALRTKYDGGSSLQDLAEETGYSLGTVRRMIVAAGGTIRRRGHPGVAAPKPRGMSKLLNPENVARKQEQQKQVAERAERTAQMLELYKQGNTLDQIGEAYSITRERVRQLLEKSGFSISAWLAANPRRRELTELEKYALALYKEKKSPREIREITGVLQGTLSYILKVTGTPQWPKGTFKRPLDPGTLATATAVAELYKQGLAGWQIVRRVPGLKHQEGIYRHLKLMGVEPNRVGSTRRKKKKS